MSNNPLETNISLSNSPTTERERKAFQRWVASQEASRRAEDAARRARDVEWIEWNSYLLALESAQRRSLADRFADALREWWAGK